MENYTCTKLPSTRKKRTAIVYFGAKSEYIEIISAFAIVRNFWRYMPGAKRAGKSPVELAGADLQGIPWLEIVNLASTSSMNPRKHVDNLCT